MVSQELQACIQVAKDTNHRGQQCETLRQSTFDVMEESVKGLEGKLEQLTKSNTELQE
jgi:hypothetical protein